MLFGLGTAVYAVVVVVLLMALRRRRQPLSEQRAARRDRRLILGGGLVLPAVVLSVVAGFTVWGIAAQPGSGDLEIEVIGHQYWWEFRYPQQGAVTANEVHIPVGREVRLLLRSADVNHSFWIPELSGKRDLIPGHVTELVIVADRPGVYRGQCAEFCGIQHANMAILAVAEEPAEFDAWVRDQASVAREPTTPSQVAGSETFQQNACAACHTIRGTPAQGEVGPDLTHLASRQTIGAGVAPNDRGHLGGWAVNAQWLKPGNHMPPVEIPADQVADLLDYLESLR